MSMIPINASSQPDDDSDEEKRMLEALSKTTNKQFIEIYQILQKLMNSNHAKFEKAYRQHQLDIDRLE